ncbi:MAG TPA: TauD/TfdA family dioxygenase [Pseudonocardiaceae bacterium]|nr:TauD/TfdA family dioxygenase [Pseudonocardiaceae bacterium]
MFPAVPLTQVLAAAESVTTTFERIPHDPIPIRGASALNTQELSRIVDRYNRHGFAIIQLAAGAATQESLLTFADALGLGEPFVPPLYLRGGNTAAKVSRISATSNVGTAYADHPSFGSTVGQRLHCDGTLQDIGYIKASLLLCESPAAEGGDTILFNASAAYARLAAIDLSAAAVLATQGVLIRQANFNGSTEMNAGPAFSAQGGRLVCRYCVTETDRWAVPDGAAEADLRRGIEFLRRASLPGSPHFRQLTLRAGQVIVFDNTRISHGRTPYRDSETHHRCLYRSLHLAHPRDVGTSAPGSAAPG